MHDVDPQILMTLYLTTIITAVITIVRERCLQRLIVMDYGSYYNNNIGKGNNKIR